MTEKNILSKLCHIQIKEFDPHYTAKLVKLTSSLR
jgi:hypothetical protein